MVAGYFMPGEGEQFEYDDLQRRKRLAEALMQQGSDYSPVQSWTQGAARIAQALSGSLQREYANKLGKQGAADYEKKMSPLYAAFAGGGSPSPAMPSAPSAPGPAPRPTAYADGEPASLIQSESGGNWQAQNDAVGAGGKVGHFGRLQFGQARLEDAITAGAIPPGTTPQQFMASPELQKAAEKWHFADIDKAIASGPAARAIGSTINGVPVTPEGLRAVAHLGGVEGMNKFVTSGGQYNPADRNGTTLMDYFKRHGGAAPQPTQVAQAGGPVASDAPPMAYAPGQQAIAQAAPQAAPRGQQLAQAVGAPAMPQPQPTGNIQAAMMQILSDPRFSPQQKAQAMQMYQMGQRDEGVRPVDLGDKIALMDARGNIRQVLPKSQAPRGPMAIGPDQRLIDPTTGREIAGAAEGKAPTTRVVKQPDGSEVALQWDGKSNAWVPLNAPQGGNPVSPKLPKLTEQQSKDVGFVQRGKAANELLTPEAEKALLSVPDTALQNLPEVLGMNVGRRFQDDKFQTAFNAGRNFLAVVLRKDTGAAITKEEWKEYTPLFIPQPGDTPDLLAQKRQNRTVAMQAMEDGLGNVGDVLNAVIGARKQAAPSNAPGATSRPDPSGALAAARDAIARGAPRDAVIKRLQENGIDAAGL